MADSKYVCVNFMCGVGADEPGLCRHCGQPVEAFDESIPLVPSALSKGHIEYLRMMAERARRREQEGEGTSGNTEEEDA